jgi:hypothetical protein
VKPEIDAPSGLSASPHRARPVTVNSWGAARLSTVMESPTSTPASLAERTSITTSCSPVGGTPPGWISIGFSPGVVDQLTPSVGGPIRAPTALPSSSTSCA